MSPPSSPPSIQTLKERLLVLQHSMAIRQSLLTAVGSDHDSGMMYDVVRQICKLARADLAYLVLFDPGEDGPVNILTVDFHSEDEAQGFAIRAVPHQTAIPRAVRVIHQPCTTVFGKIQLQGSLALPVVRRGQAVGLVELGWQNRSPDPDHLRHATRVHQHLIAGYQVVQDHLATLDARRNLKSELNQTRRMYDMILAGSHDMILTLDPEARILSANATGRTILGLTDGTPGRLVLANPSMEFILSRLSQGAVLSDVEVAIHPRPDQTIFCLASFSAEWGLRNNIISVYGVFKDITDRIEAQHELWKANLELTELNQQLKANQQQMVQQEKLASIGQLAAGIAHEINNPLGFVQSNHITAKTYIQKIQAYIGDLESLAGVGQSYRKEKKVQRALEDLPQLLEESDEGYHRIMKIVQSLKDFSRIDNKGALSPVNLNQALDDTLTVARNTWKYVAEVETDYQLVRHVECYLDELNQVFLNLVVNAAQAIADQGRKEPGHIRISTREEGNMAVITLDDDGPGIPPHIWHRIFEPFFTTKPVGQGTGLGLSLAYDTVVKKHGGRLQVDRSPLGGARFVVRLPLLQDKDARDLLE